MYTYTYRGSVITRTRDDWGRLTFTVGCSPFGFDSLGAACDSVDCAMSGARFRATVEEWSV